MWRTIALWAVFFLGLLAAQFLRSDVGSAALWIYPFACVVLGAVVSHYATTSLLRYLNGNYPSVWRELTYGIKGSYRSARVLVFVFSKSRSADPELQSLRQSAKRATLLVLAIFFHLPVAGVLAEALQR